MKKEIVTKRKNKKEEKVFCRHDYKNAIQIGKVDYVCPLCKELLNPLEWFFMNSFEFVEVKAAPIVSKNNHAKKTEGNKKYDLADASKIQFKGKGKKLSANVDKIVY